jgi:hypothetical protein
VYLVGLHDHNGDAGGGDGELDVEVHHKGVICREAERVCACETAGGVGGGLPNKGWKERCARRDVCVCVCVREG